MKAILTDKSELRLSDLTREYTFDITDDNGNVILSSQVTTQRPSEIRSAIETIVAEYQSVYEDVNDLEIGEEI